MFGLYTSFAALLLGAAVASPLPPNVTVPSASSPSNIKLRPVSSTSLDGQSLDHLLGTKSFQLHYDSDPNPATDSMIGTVSASNASHPVIQLENSDFIRSVQCTGNSATIVFNNKTAFQTAAADWKQHDQFVLFSHDPNCGSGYDRGTRDYALVDSFQSNNDTMTIKASLEFVDYATAVGKDTTIHISVGHYQPPKSKRVSKSFPLEWNAYPTGDLSTTQFGPGYQLLASSELDAICVGCGTAGQLTFGMDVDLSFFHGIKSASASMSGNMAATLALGLVAKDLHGKIPIANVPLAQIALPGFEIPDIATFGPQIDLSAAADVELSATGTMQLGTTLSWSNIDVKLGLDNDNTQTASGLAPSASPTFQASGTMSATLDLSLPVSVGVGINILNGKFDKQLALVDTPTFALTGEDGTSDSTSCSGIGLSGALENNVAADIIGLTTIGLASTSIPLFSTCLGSSTAATSSAATTTSSATTVSSATTTSAAATTSSATTSSAAATTSAPTTLIAGYPTGAV